MMSFFLLIFQLLIKVTQAEHQQLVNQTCTWDTDCPFGKICEYRTINQSTISGFCACEKGSFFHAHVERCLERKKYFQACLVDEQCLSEDPNLICAHYSNGIKRLRRCLCAGGFLFHSQNNSCVDKDVIQGELYK